MTENLPHRKLVAILAADVVGYSRMVRLDEEWAVSATAARFDNVLRPAIATHRGRVFKTIGDGLLAEFASVVDAVNCAAAIQRVMAEQNAVLDEGDRVVLRVGVNLGDVVVRDGDLHGDGVNLAARLESLADPGGVLISSSTYEQVRDKIDLPFIDLGLRQAKNIDRPLHVFALTDESGNDTTGSVRGAQRSGSRLVAPLVAVLALGVALAGVWVLLPQGTAPIPEDSDPTPEVAVVEPSQPSNAVPDASIDTGADADAALEEPAEPFEPLFALPDEPSLAILPFEPAADGASSGAETMFARAVSDRLLTDLSRVPGVFVAAPDSTGIAARSVEPTGAAEILGVRHVLTGTVERSAEALRVTASLVDAQENVVLWEDQFDGRPEDVFVIGGTIAHDVTAAMGVAINDAQSNRMGQVPNAPFGMWERYLAARSTADSEQALGKLVPIVDQAPDFVEAEALRARLLAELAVSGTADDPAGLLDAATDHAETAMALDDTDSDARMALALVQLALGTLDDAIETHRGTLAAQPNNAAAQGHLGIVLTYAGRYDEAIVQLEKALRRDPENTDAPYRAMLGLARFALGEYEAAGAIWQDVVALRGSLPSLAPFRVAAFAALGDARNADTLRNSVLEANPSYSVTNDRILRAFSGEEQDRLATLLMAAGLPE